MLIGAWPWGIDCERERRDQSGAELTVVEHLPQGSHQTKNRRLNFAETRDISLSEEPLHG